MCLLGYANFFFIFDFEIYTTRVTIARANVRLTFASDAHCVALHGIDI